MLTASGAMSAWEDQGPAKVWTSEANSSQLDVKLTDAVKNLFGLGSQPLV